MKHSLTSAAAVFLAALLIVGLLPSGAFADEYTPGEHMLRIDYVDQNGLFDQYEAMLLPGDEYSVASPIREGYETDCAVVSGKMGDEDIHITVTYTWVGNDLTVPNYTDETAQSSSKSDLNVDGSSSIGGSAPGGPALAGGMGTDPVILTGTAAPASYTLSGLPTENAAVTVNGAAVTPDADGKISVCEGDDIRIIPAKGYDITGFESYVAADPVIILNYPEDVWYDGTGYQLLLDADHDLYPVLMSLGSNVRPDRFDTYGSFDGFEYFIPQDADYFAHERHAVYPGNSVSITVPAGIYDMCIINPSYTSDHIGIYFVGMDDVGDVPKGRKDDIVFEKSMTYEFLISENGFDGDQATITVTDSENPLKPADYGTPGENGAYGFTMPAEDVDLSVTLSPVVYVLVEGGSQKYIPGSGTPLRFVFKRETNDPVTFERFDGVSVDGKLLTEGTDFTKTAGSVIIELQPSFLDTLSLGGHSIKVSFTDADGVEAPFVVVNDSIPDTGVYSNMLVYAVLLATALLSVYEIRKNRRLQKR